MPNAASKQSGRKKINLSLPNFAGRVGEQPCDGWKTMIQYCCRQPFSRHADNLQVMLGNEVVLITKAETRTTAMTGIWCLDWVVDIGASAFAATMAPSTCSGKSAKDKERNRKRKKRGSDVSVASKRERKCATDGPSNAARASTLSLPPSRTNATNRAGAVE